MFLEGSNTVPGEPRNLLSEQRRQSHQLGRGARGETGPANPKHQPRRPPRGGKYSRLPLRPWRWGKGQSAFRAAGFRVLTQNPRSRHRAPQRSSAGWRDDTSHHTAWSRDQVLSALTLRASLSRAAPRLGRRGMAPSFHMRGKGRLPVWRRGFRVFPATEETVCPGRLLSPSEN